MNIFRALSWGKTPAILPLIKTETFEQFAVGLERGQLLARHLTRKPAHLLVLKGSVHFISEQASHTLTEHDFFPIPVNEFHEVRGLDEKNIFLVTRQR
ncbi:MAG: hypothetical protein MUC38_01635 [Cyclobacteriaceae bacterium]|jgi:quercetin dioxygenase-like cupin family protein|nr:hypothetical protein [Cyclobacteriaceae bacterium]